MNGDGVVRHNDCGCRLSGVRVVLVSERLADATQGSAVRRWRSRLDNRFFV
jgi:hypothetical protein